MDYFYAGQLRAYRVQLIRAFSNFYVNFGTPDVPNLRRVPCRYGDTSRLAEMILNGGSENTMPTAPFISLYVTGMSLAPERRAAPSLVSTLNVNEREYAGKYLDSPGNRYTVKRYMPVPFTMTINVDFWTTNLTQKEELFEQTQVLFNGIMDIQTSNNPLDWTLFSTLEPTNITWSSRSIPIGTDNPMDVMTVEYRVPIFINPPALVTYQQLIEQVVMNINTGETTEGSLEWTQADLLARQITTPDNARIGLQLVDDGVYEISLQSVGGSTQDPEQRPTVIRGRSAPQLLPGTSFLINDVPITIPNQSVDDLIMVMRTAFQGKNLNVRLSLRGTLELINLSGGDITLMNVQGAPVEALGFVSTTYPGGALAWWRLLEQYGSLDPILTASACEGGVMSGSELRLLRSDDLDSRDQDIVGFIQLHPTNQNLLIWRVQDTTWPQATMPPVTAIINPQNVFPGTGLASADASQRYLLVDEIAPQSVAWGSVTAGANDIIAYDGTAWHKVFDHESVLTPQYVKNQFSQKWFQFSEQGWQPFPASHVMPGYWRLRL